MAKTQTILVPVDFSECSRPALDCAASIAAPLAAEIHVVHVWETPEFIPKDLRPESIAPGERALVTLTEEHAQGQLDAFVAQAKKDAVPIARSFTAAGRPSNTIVATAGREHYDLVVMGTHGRTGFSHVMLGSVAERVVRQAPCPVLTLRGAGPARALKLRRILVPVDYSDTSRSALDYAERIGRAFGAELDIVHVWDRPAFVSGDVMVHERDGSRKSLGDLIREGAENEMRSFLDARRQSETQTTPSRPAYRLLAGEPASTLITELEKGAHDLVVLGTRGHTGLRHLLLGSVAEKLVRHAPVPVLTVPPPERVTH